MGDNAGSALGMGLAAGDMVVSIGTSGVVCGVSDVPSRDASGLVSGFADATGRFLPLACTLNGARVLDATARTLGVDHDALSALALGAAPARRVSCWCRFWRGAHPEPAGRDRQSARSDAGLDDPANLARAAVEGWCARWSTRSPASPTRARPSPGSC
ncbi:hypothetical protein [Tessaracoccus coleopterorum]|uniref:hypothetical protein n=1 Tax=Tessaracoccus coleopterorum TaxID=2714950 RepID=UPI001E382702|nr:hypothetical protein [Tessaracoccus coleopterorum]